MTRRLLGLAAVFLAALPARGQGGVREPVRVQVTAVAGGSAYLDRGSVHGLRAGDRVRLDVPGFGPFEARLADVASRSSRVELTHTAPTAPVGTTGEAWPTGKEEESEAADPVPVEWERQEEAREEDQPLLVPAFGDRADQRPARIRGRVFTSFGFWRDRGAGRDADYGSAQTGLRFAADNLLGNGGSLRFDGTLDGRWADVAQSSDQDSFRGRIDQLSHAWGVDQRAPFRAEVGRFYSHSLPEIGLIDGAEAFLRVGESLRVGAGAGFLPLPFSDLDTGDDFGTHVFVQYTDQGKGPATVQGTLGYQKTWHRGSPDRDLVIARGLWRPSRVLRVLASGRFDVYGSGARLKDSGPELTYGDLRVDVDPTPRFGFGVYASRFRWPELERRIYSELPDEVVRDGRSDRYGFDARFRVTDELRLTGRVEGWEDRDASGARGEITAWLRRWPADAAGLRLTVQRTSGTFLEGLGFRGGLDLALSDDLSTDLEYDWLDNDLQDQLGGGASVTRQSLRATLDYHPLGPLSAWLGAGVLFGDEEDALTLDLFVQYRF